ncbi:hypothetical protein [Hymenobacter sp. PAMC 26628]|uniref:hypothetical protein n=1 Tax=Hymenobacter sp. PAMC 26628 TaxID=1484118 RepID=UPI000A983CA6|nr:hypothetical protein [Hymenobacter sp. PAMC 26628]
MPSKQHREIFANPCWVSYLAPFKLIVPNGEKPLEVPLEEINSNTYNHGKLCRIVEKLPLKEIEGFSTLVCYDGAIAVPKFGRLSSKENAVNFYNRLFAALILGGIMCEAVDKRDIVSGQLHENRAVWPVDLGGSASSHLHAKLRMRYASNLDSILLLKPSYVFLVDFIHALKVGNQVLDMVKNLTATFLVRGITEISYKNWATALSNLWISVEQIIDFVWNRGFLGTDKFNGVDISSRPKNMREDNRTWSMSVKQELLYQSGLLSAANYALIYPARQARNKLVHEGKAVEQEVVLNLYSAIRSMLTELTGEKSLLIDIVTVMNNHPSGQNAGFGVEHFKSWPKHST